MKELDFLKRRDDLKAEIVKLHIEIDELKREILRLQARIAETRREKERLLETGAP